MFIFEIRMCIWQLTNCMNSFPDLHQPLMTFAAFVQNLLEAVTSPHHPVVIKITKIVLCCQSKISFVQFLDS